MAHLGLSWALFGILFAFWDPCDILAQPSPSLPMLELILGPQNQDFSDHVWVIFLTNLRICFSTISDIILEAVVGSDQPKKGIKMGPGGLAEIPKIQKAAFAKTSFP